MRKVKKFKMSIGILLVIALFICTVFAPLQSALAIDTTGAQTVTRGAYYDLPETVNDYLSSGKTLEFDLNILIKDTDVCKMCLHNGTTMISNDFLLKNGSDGLVMEVKPLEDGWYHYSVTFASISLKSGESDSKVTRIRVKTAFPSGTQINNIGIGKDVYSSPEEFTEDFDTVTLGDLGITGTDYETPVSGGTYTYDGKSESKSVVLKFGWDANVTEGNDWKIALDTFWNANCMVWLLPNLIYFCPGNEGFTELQVIADPVTTGRHDVEFGRLRVTAGPNYGKDFVFIKIDGEVRASAYTYYYQTQGGYIAYKNGSEPVYTKPSYTVCLVGEGVSAQRFSGLAKPDEFTEDYDTVTLADLGLAGTDYKTPVDSDTYHYNGKSKTKSVIVKFGWDANVTDDTQWKIALDTYWNANCMAWFLPGLIYFCPGQGDFRDLSVIAKPVTTGRHDVEFGRLRVTEGVNKGKDYVFIKIDGEVFASKFTNYYQTEGGYVAYESTKTTPSYTVCLVGDGVSEQRFSGFAKPDEYAADIDYVNIGDIVPGGVVKNTVPEDYMSHTYPYTGRSKTNSVVVKYVVKTGDLQGTYDDSVMVVDIGGNCGFCRSYIPMGNKDSIMFGWEIEGCKVTTKNYKFESNSWYAIEQGRIKIISGINKGKDYVYLKINGEIVSSFYGNPESKPLASKMIYTEATGNIQILGYNEVSAKYYVDGNLYLEQSAQKGFTVKQPENPNKEGEYFIGWYTEKTGGKLFDFNNTKLTGNINLYARFTDRTVNAAFYNNGGVFISNETVGKGCLVAEPSIPSYSGSSEYEQVFVGWKNETTGKMFNFRTDRISADTVFTAQYKEKEYYVSYYANGTLVKKVPFVLSNPTVSGKEPAVPSIPNATGVWEKHNVNGLTKSITVNAVYNSKSPSASTAIKLEKFSGGKVYINTDTVHSYLNTDTAKNQTAFIRDYCGLTYEFQDHQNTSFKWTDSGKNSKYTVYFADNKDFNNAFIVTTANKSLVNEVGIFVPGKKYYWYVSGNNTGKCSEADSFTVVNTPVRYITAGKVTNMRDEGGYMTQDGSKVKYGLVYRGAALDEYHSHIDDEARKVFSYLGIKSEIELRGEVKHDNTGWDENNSNAYCITGYGYEPMLTIDEKTRNEYKAVFEAMADKNNYPFYFHCSAGADRTGSFAYLLNGLLGVPYEDLRKDYELTSFSEVGPREADTNANGSFDEMNRLIMEKYGKGTGNLQVAVENYLKEFIGLDGSVLDAIKDIMLEKTAEPNEKSYTVTVDVLGKKYTYKAFKDVYFMPEVPEVAGKIFRGLYNGNTKYNGYVKGNTDLVAKFEDIQYEPYDTITLKDLGIKDNKIYNQTNTTYVYNKTAKSGGRLFQFILEPIGNMKNGEGPQIALTNDFSKSSYARVWFQNNTMSHVYYSGVMDSLPDVSKMLSLEAGKQYNIEYSVRIMKNEGYEGKKIFEVKVNGELFIQYIGCNADLSGNMIFFHGSKGAAYLINKPVYKTVKFYNGNTLMGTYKVERSSIIPNVKEPSAKNGIPFAGWYTKQTGGTLWNDNSDLVYNDMSLYAHFADVKKVTVNIDGKTSVYRIETGKTLDSIPKPKKSCYVFMGWAQNGKIFTGKVTKDMTVTAVFEKYSFDSYDSISLRDLGIYGDFDFSSLGSLHIGDYTYCKTAKTGGRVFKGIYVPTKDMINGPQISFSANWNENFCSKLYFVTSGEIWIYSSGVVDGEPTFKLQTDLVAGKEYSFEIGVRVLNNKGYEGVKVLTVYLNGKLVYEELGNKAPLEGNTVFFQGETKKGILRNIDIYKTVNLYNGNKLYGSFKVRRGDLLPAVKEPASANGLRFAGWYTAKTGGSLFDENTTPVYNNINLYARFADVKKITVNIDGKTSIYRIETGKTLDSIPKPKKSGYVFMGWAVNGKVYTGKVTKDMTVTAVFEKYSFDSYDSISLKDLGIKGDFDFSDLGNLHIGDYTYHKTAKTGGRVFKAVYVPVKDMVNGPQISFSANWSENFRSKLYFITNNELWIYSSGVVDGEPTRKIQTNLTAGKEYSFEIGVRVLKNKGYEGTKVLTVYLDGKLVYEELGNKTPLEGNTVFFQGETNKGILRNVQIYKTVKLYNGSKLYSTLKVLRGDLLPAVKEPSPKNGLRFAGWYTKQSGGTLFDENTDCVYNSMSLYAHFADIKKVTAKIDGKTYIYRVETGKSISSIPKPKKSGCVFTGWAQNGKIFTGKVTKDMTVTAVFEKYSFDSYDEISLKDLGIKGDFDFSDLGNLHIGDYTYHKTAKTGGRVFKAVYIPSKDMINGPQISFSAYWNENFRSKLYFITNNEVWIYSSGVVDGEPSLKFQIDPNADKEYFFEIGVRVLNNKGYEGTKVFTVYINGKLIFEELGNKTPLEGNTVFFQGETNKGILRNVQIYKTVKLYNGSKLYSTLKVLRGDLLPAVKEPSPKNGLRFAGWYTKQSGGTLFDENTDCVYNSMSLYAHFADIKKVTVTVDGKTMLYRIKTGDTLDSIPKPEKSGNVFAGWMQNGKIFTGKVTKDMTVTAVFEKYSFDSYDEISLKDLGIKGDFDFSELGSLHIGDYNYYKTAKTGGRVFKAVYIPSKDMSNGPQISFSANWEENFCSKVYFITSDEIWIYSSGIVDGTPTKKIRFDTVAGKQYIIEIGVRVLNNKGYKGVKVFTVYLDGNLIFEELDNKTPLEGNTVFFQGEAKKCILRNVDIYNTVSFYDGDKLLSKVKVLKGNTVKSYGNLRDKGNMLFKGWIADNGIEWNFDTDKVYTDVNLSALYQKRSYPVSLMVDGVLYKRINVDEGSCLNVDNKPEKEGFVFDKWLCEDGTEYDMTKPVMSPLTLNARFNALPESDKNKESNSPIENEKSDSLKWEYILFCVIGLAVIVTETGFIITKKRSKH